MGVDHDLVLLPPFMLVDPAFPLGSDECVGELDPTDMERECVLPAPAGSSDSPTNIDSITESIASLRLRANEA
jgi:hypothetical protein